MRHHLLSATLAAGLLLAGCATDTPEATVTEPTTTDDDRPLVWAPAGMSAREGELEIRTVLSGSGGADLIVQRGTESEDVTLQVGESTEVFGHTLELVSADAEEALLAVTAPDGTQLGG